MKKTISKKNVLVVKNRILGKGISETTNVENPKICFRTTNLLENMQKNFDGPILNKIPPRELEEVRLDLRAIDIK